MIASRIIITGRNADIGPFPFRLMAGYADAAAAQSLRHINGATAHPSSIVTSVQPPEAAGAPVIRPAADLPSSP